MKLIKGKNIGFILSVIGIFVLFISLGQLAPKDKDDKTIAKEFEVLGQVAPEGKVKSLEDYQEINSDIVFLLEFEERVLPIVNSKDNDAYFRTNIYGEYDSMGTPFIDEVSSVYSENIIIQGHSSSKNKFLFSFVSDLTKESNNEFKLIYEDREIEFMMIGIAEIDLTKEDAWLGYYQQDFRPGEKEMMINRFLENSFIKYEEGILNYETSLVTLVTCDVEEENSRFVIIAREK